MTSQVHAYLINRGRIWVESITTDTAIVRFDCGTGIRSRSQKVRLDQIDFSREWKF